jgi:hypothetical protein
MKKCNCFALSYQYLNLTDIKYKPCLNLNQSYCIYQQEKSFNTSECQVKSCPLECDSVKYELSLSSQTNPSLKEFYSLSAYDKDHYEKLLGRSPLTYDLFKSMWISLNVYYPTLEYTMISETPKITLIDLFTQIGGSLSLFVSFSVFSLFEFIELALLCLNVFIFK